MKTMLRHTFLMIAIAAARAHSSEPETIYILAPKQGLTLSTDNQLMDTVDSRYQDGLNRTIADRLTSLPGVSLAGQGGQFQSYAIRGFSRGRIRTEVDGVPIITDRAAGNALSFIAPSLISSARVVKGPSSAIYGSQALGGVVSVSTEMDDQTELDVSMQSNSKAINVSIKHQDQGLTSAFAYQQVENTRTANGDDLNSQFERISGVLRYTQTQGDISTSFSWLPSVGQAIGKSNSRFPETEISNYPEELHSIAQLQIHSGRQWSAKLFHHYQDWQSSTVRIDSYNSYQANNDYQSHTLGGQWLTSIQSGAEEQVFGIDWLGRRGVQIDSDYELFDVSLTDDDSLFSNTIKGDQDNIAVYSNSRWQWQQNILNLALRYDWINQQSYSQKNIDAQFNASLTVNVPMGQALMLSMNVANGFRYPTLSERYFNGRTPRGFIAGNQALLPETSVGSEVMLDWQVNDRMTLHTAVYYYDLDNYIERYQQRLSLISYQNVAKAKRYGVETVLTWLPSDHLEHHVSYQQQHASDSQGQFLEGVAPKRLTWRTLWRWQDLSIANAINHVFATEQVAMSEQPRDRATLWNMALDYHLNESHTMSLMINNIGNSLYYGSADTDAPLQPGRSATLQIRWQL